MRTIPLDIGTLHFIGIGGIGMSGIAEVLHDLGYAVQGSDLAEGGNVQRLREKGIRVTVGHVAKNLNTEDGDMPAVVVISSAVKADNPELIAAREQLLPVVRRAEMLAELMRLKWAVAIGGTHGKTTTTSMIGTMLEEGKFDPTVINGGIVNAYGTNTRLGQSDWMVVEADESDGTFTRLPATIVVVTNMDPEHMEHYGTFDAVREAYRQFVENIPFYGFAAMCLDHPEVQTLVSTITDRRVITYGFNPQADVQAQNVTFKNGVATFDVVFAPWMNDGKLLELPGVNLPMLGLHNVQNSLASLTVGHAMGMKPAMMKRALEKFTGVKRRFTKTGESNGITVIDDYGHHPVEIAAVLKAGCMAVADTGGKIIAVFQPHRYSRLSNLFDDFCNGFNDAEIVIVADVYAAGEQPIEGADKDHLVEGIKKHGHRNVMALSGPDDLAETIVKLAEPGDYVICLGAGNITQWAYALPGQLDQIVVDPQKSESIMGLPKLNLEELPLVRGRYTESAPLGEVGWFRAGGTAEVLFKPADKDDLAEFLVQCPEDISVTTLGVLSNTIVRDGGVRGVVIRLGREFADIQVGDDLTVSAGSAAIDVNVAKFAAEAGIAGLEFLSGVPGTIGGALRMNAGAYGTETKDVLVEATALNRQGQTLRMNVATMGMGYRHTMVPEDYIYTGAVFRGVSGDKEKIEAHIADIKAKRSETQPIKARTGGSTFANPKPAELAAAGQSEELKAWQLIDRAGCRGLKIGGAQMSELHCNFMINTGTATASDLESLGEEVRKRVQDKSGIMLRWEIKRIGETL